MVGQQLEAEERRSAAEQACKSVLDQLAQKAGFANCSVAEGIDYSSSPLGPLHIYTLELDTTQFKCVCPVCCLMSSGSQEEKEAEGPVSSVQITTYEVPASFKCHCWTSMLVKCAELLQHNSSDGRSWKLVAYPLNAVDRPLCESIEHLELLASLAGLDGVQQL